ncbi:MAG: thioesterase family protein [Candidatus Eisenbacteria bacterium]|uniref:Acyl-CoA thioesterase n=1 Tax=Eiseniibacteriota bacterium TaxID=2212470 RepID=A0A956M1Z1_UNCEI|nr:acyl-CoA thioesterase [Candidatus Eisenbacteria bacterium]
MKEPGPDPLAGVTHVRVYFADTDQMGVVYNGRYLTWCEIGRTELLRDAGLPYALVESRGVSLPVTEATLRVRRPARYDDLVRIETVVSGLRTREVRFRYLMWRDDVCLVEAETAHVPVDRDAGHAVRLPQWLRDALVP